MTPSTSRRVRIVGLLLAGALFIPLEALLLPDLLDHRPLCVRAAEWVSTNQGNLPQLYDEISSFPLAYRKAIFANLLPEVRAALWREQLSRFKVQRTLDDQQEEFVDRNIRDMLVADSYVHRPASSLIKAILQDVEALFPDHEDRRIFVRLGPEKPRLASFEGSRLQLAFKIQQALDGVTSVRASFGSCTCNVEAAGWFPWECPSIIPCTEVSCTQYNACGLFGLSTCTGCCCDYMMPSICNCVD